jgi:hypothetical protein
MAKAVQRSAAMTKALVPYEEARKALADCKRVDEAKGIKDKADAMRVYATQAKDRQLFMDAVEISANAQRKLGELLAEAKKRGDLDRGKGGDRRSRSKNTTVKLSDLGIDKHLSSAAQRLAKYSQPQFEKVIQDWRKEAADGSRVTVNMLTYAKTKYRPKHKEKPTKTGSNETQVKHGETNIVEINFGGGHETDEVDARTPFLARAEQARAYASYSGPVDQAVIDAAEAVASAWSELAGKLKTEMSGGDEEESNDHSEDE